MTFVASESFNSSHFSVRAIASFVASQARARVVTRLESSSSATSSNTKCFSVETGNDRTVVGLELSRSRLDEFNTRDKGLSRVSSRSTKVTLRVITISNLTIMSSTSIRPAISTCGTGSTSSLRNSVSSINALLRVERTFGAIIVTEASSARSSS